MNKKTIVGICGFLVVIAVMLLIYKNFQIKPTEGSKSITIEVIDSKEASVLYRVKTDAAFLEQAMNEAETSGLTYHGEEGEYGLMIDTVNGEFAEYNTNNAYWSFYLNDELCLFGISEQPVNDGDAFKIVFTKAE